MTPSTRVAAVCVFLGVLVVAQRVHTAAEPFDRDVATYSVIARELRAGRELYSDLWDHKLPFLYVAYAAAQVVGGEGAGGVLVIGCAAALLTLFSLYRAGALRGSDAGLCAAAFWAVLSADLPLQANQPNTEMLLNAGGAAAFALLATAGADNGRWRSLGAGACLALAVLVKPFVGLTVAALALAHVLAPPTGRGRWRAFGDAAAMVAVVAAACVAVAGYFWARGRFAPFWSAVVLYNEHFAGRPLTNLAEGLKPARLFAAPTRHLLPLAVAALAGGLAFARRPSREAILLGAWIVTVPLAVAAPGMFWPHYYQLWLPPLCLAAAWGIQGLAARTPRPALALAVAGGAVLAALTATQWPGYALTADEWSRAKYGDVFLRTRDVGTELAAMLPAGETFYQWGNEPELYLYTRRRPPSGFLWSQPLQHGPGRNGFRARALDQLSRQPPEMLVMNREEPGPPGALGRWLAANYDPHPARRRRAGFSYWVRRDGRIQTALID
jgi:hypothetical protein